MFVLYLPAAPVVHEAAAAEPEPKPVEPAAPPPIPEAEPFKETILLVDDEAGIRGLVRRILMRERYNVIEAASGEEALAVAVQHSGPIHMVLTDVNMPGMNGPQLVKSIQGPFPDVKAVFISGQADAVQAGEFPGAAFLQKPFTLTDLLRVVRGALSVEKPQA